MPTYRKLIRQLAVSRDVARGTERTARLVRDRAKQLDPDGEFTIEPAEISIRGMRRIGWRVVNNADDAAVSEFGADGVPATRPLGRAGRAFKG